MVSYAITGASRGLGLEFIRQLSRDQTNIVFAIVRNTTSSPALTELAEANPNVHVVHGDLDSLESLREAAKTVAKITGGSLDVLINNGAFLDDSAAVMLPPSQFSEPENWKLVKGIFNQSVESNVFGAIHVTNFFLPLIEQGNAKKIIHIGTGLADTDLTLKSGIAGLVPYSASKAMLNLVVAKYGAELQPKGIHVICISPGWVDTNPMPQEALDWMTSVFQKVDPRIKGRITPEESVRDQLETISKLNWNVQGKMISQHGNTDWY